MFEAVEQSGVHVLSRDGLENVQRVQGLMMHLRDVHQMYKIERGIGDPRAALVAERLGWFAGPMRWRRLKFGTCKRRLTRIR